MAYSKAYVHYINSFAWYLKRRAAIERAGGRCQRCQTMTGLEVHHLTYDRLGNEKDEDLLVVCEPCHKKADAERAANERLWRARRRQQNRVDGWAKKKYGENWWMWKQYDEVEEEFEAWVRRKREEEEW